MMKIMMVTVIHAYIYMCRYNRVKMMIGYVDHCGYVIAHIYTLCDHDVEVFIFTCACVHCILYFLHAHTRALHVVQVGSFRYQNF